MLLINLIIEFCVVIVQAGYTPRAWYAYRMRSLVYFKYLIEFIIIVFMIQWA